jgi:aconitate hydratase
VGQSLARRLIESHLVEGEMRPGEEIGIRVDQTLAQDATGTLVMLELEAMGLDRVRTELSAQYVDHNLLQADHRNADDHVFLRSACRRFGVWYAPPGTGVSHVVHMERFGKPGKTLLGADSHTPAAGSLGMLAIGAGGLEVAMAMAGEPFRLAMPRIVGVHVVGRLPDWVSAKDVILEVLRRIGVRGGVGKILEWRGPGLASLGAMDRHVIANMGAETGATTSVFPADDEVRRFLEAQGRGGDFIPVKADADATYDEAMEIDLGALVPLVAMPSSPGNVVPVREIAGLPVHQAYVGSSANPGWRDLAIASEMLRGRRVKEGVSFDANPASRRVLATLVRDGHLLRLVNAGARLHQTGCNGCIGMGQAPATGKASLRTVPRNFPGRSGTKEDAVYLVSPETATAAAITGVVTDPRDLGMPYPRVVETAPLLDADGPEAPPPAREAGDVVLEKGPDIGPFPAFPPLPDRLSLPVLLKVGDDLSTDEILPAGARVLPHRSHVERIAEFAFDAVDPTYARRAKATRLEGGHAIVAGENYGQGSSREHAAIAPRFLGLRLVLAKSFARIHGQNLVNFGVVPLEAVRGADLERLEEDDVLEIDDLVTRLDSGRVTIRVVGKGSIEARHRLSPRQVEVLDAGGLVSWAKARLGSATPR